MCTCLYIKYIQCCILNVASKNKNSILRDYNLHAHLHAHSQVSNECYFRKNTSILSKSPGFKLSVQKLRSWHPVPSLHGK